MPKLSKALATLREREAGRFFIRGVGSAEIAEALTKDGRFGSVSLR
ncbi:MAG TPA: hypothetical protein VLV31_06935 [Candidatus Acidoferrales bacterium]|nr:hypothetical protein [Candidatus Acidoferrales bacterium]